MAPRSSTTARALLLAALVVAGASVVSEVQRARRIYAFDAEPASFSERWRVGSPDWRALEEFTAWIDNLLPPGSVVAFRSEPVNPVLAWNAAYLLPRHEVLPLNRQRQLVDADYVAMYRRTWSSPDFEPFLEHPNGFLYRRKAE